MSSLAQLAELTNDVPLLERVKAFYDNGLRQIADQIGWVIESSGDAQHEGHLDRGEINNTGDIVETALILGRFGYTGYYEDAERITRCHILPSQLRDIAFIVEPDNPENVDGLRDVAARHQGAFGFPAPYGHEPVGCENVSFNLDIVGGGVGSLCEVYRDAARYDKTGHHISLLFDHETDAIQVESNYTHDMFGVTLKKPGPLWVRIPSWANPGDVVRTVPEGRLIERGLFLADHPIGKQLELRYGLPSRDIVLKHRSRDIRTRLRGDTVEAMDDFDADLTFFDKLP